MSYVRPKKRLGQHFLKDLSIASDIVEALFEEGNPKNVLEIGPGTGVLSDFLVKKELKGSMVLMDLDEESIAFLQRKYGKEKAKIVHADFLKTNLDQFFGSEPISIIGNFPYNISSQIFFKILESPDSMPLVVGMLQKEVAQRIAAKEGNKTYGILSVLLQVYYDIDYLFEVPAHVFDPPPKVMSAVIRLKRNKRTELETDPALFTKVVKLAFQTRRKTLRNALKTLNLPESIRASETLDKRAEQLSVNDFIQLTQWIKKESSKK